MLEASLKRRGLPGRLIFLSQMPQIEEYRGEPGNLTHVESLYYIVHRQYSQGVK